MEEERLAQRHRLDGVVETLAFVQLHLGAERKGHSLQYWGDFITHGEVWLMRKQPFPSQQVSGYSPHPHNSRVSKANSQ